MMIWVGGLSESAGEGEEEFAEGLEWIAGDEKEVGVRRRGG